jgi:hypothetical protein
VQDPGFLDLILSIATRKKRKKDTEPEPVHLPTKLSSCPLVIIPLTPFPLIYQFTCCYYRLLLPEYLLLVSPKHFCVYNSFYPHNTDKETETKR